MGASKGGAWWRSPRIWVGGTALADLVARAPADIIAPVASLLGGVFGGPSVAFVTTWLLIVVVFYQFAPLAYNFVDALPRDEPVFRAIFATGGLALGMVWAMTPPLPILSILLGTGWIIFGGVILSYLLYIREWNLLDPDGPAIEIQDLFHPSVDAKQELASGPESEGVFKLFALGTFSLATALALALPIIVAGALTIVFRFAYPFPDLLFLGWVVSTALSARVSIGPSKDQELGLQFDLERYLVDALENATRSFEGALLTVFVLAGMVFATRYLIALRYFTSLTVTDGFRFPVNSIGGLRILVDLWIDIGGIVLLVFAFGFALWAWIRELRRLPHFLDQWEDRTTTTDRLVSRPPGLVALPAAIAGVVMALGSSIAYVPTLWYGFAVLWPVVVGTLGMVGLRTVERPPQPVTYENYWIAGGLCLELLSFIPLAVLWGSGEFWLFGPATLVILTATGYPGLKRHVRDATGWSKYVYSWFLIGLAGLLLALPGIFSIDYPSSMFGFIGILVLGGISLGLIGWSDI